MLNKECIMKGTRLKHSFTVRLFTTQGLNAVSKYKCVFSHGSLLSSSDGWFTEESVVVVVDGYTTVCIWSASYICSCFSLPFSFTF